MVAPSPIATTTPPIIQKFTDFVSGVAEFPWFPCKVLFDPLFAVSFVILEFALFEELVLDELLVEPEPEDDEVVLEPLEPLTL